MSHELFSSHCLRLLLVLVACITPSLIVRIWMKCRAITAEPFAMCCGSRKYMKISVPSLLCRAGATARDFYWMQGQNGRVGNESNKVKPMSGMLRIDHCWAGFACHCFLCCTSLGSTCFCSECSEDRRRDWQSDICAFPVHARANCRTEKVTLPHCGQHWTLKFVA